MAVKKKEETVVQIKAIPIKEAIIRIVGDAPLICHKWDEKAKRMLPAGKRASGDDITKGTEYKSPVESFIESLYWISGKPKEYTQEAFEEAVANGAEWGFRCEAIKQAAISAAYLKGWIKKKTVIRGQMFIRPDAVTEEGYQLVKIHGEPPKMREDIVVLSGISRAPDLRWRGEFQNWYCDVRVAYDADGEYTIQDISNMFNAGGLYCGLGEWRPERDGQFGTFHVDAKKR